MVTRLGVIAVFLRSVSCLILIYLLLLLVHLLICNYSVAILVEYESWFSQHLLIHQVFLILQRVHLKFFHKLSLLVHDLLYRVHLLCLAVSAAEFLCVWVTRCELPCVAADDSPALSSTTWGIIVVQCGETSPNLLFVFNWLFEGNFDWLLMVMCLHVLMLCVKMLLFFLCRLVLV